MGKPSPSDKLLLVQALKRRGHVVAVTRDGTNNVPALHEADIGLAMGIQGTEVAKESSDIIILDNNFASVVKVANGGIGNGVGNYVDGNNNVNGVRKHSSATAQFKLKSVSYGDISDNTKCKLLHSSVDGVVGEGRISSTDPKVKVHHVPLSASC